MMVFSTPFCKKFSFWLAFVSLFLAANVAMAAGIAVERAELIPAEEAYHLNAEFGIEFNQEVEEAVNKGVALSFLVEFVLMETHSYWFDEEVSSASQVVRLSYHALSRQYLLNSGSHQTTFSSLQDALGALGNVHGWPVVEKSQLAKGSSYYAMLRMRLDQTRLPKPLQVGAIGSEKWNLISERHRWVPAFDKPVVIEKSISEKPGPEKATTEKPVQDK